MLQAQKDKKIKNTDFRKTHLNMKKKLLILSILLSYALLAFSIPTRLTVRAKAKDAKFVGSSIGGALILVKNAQTGELLATLRESWFSRELRSNVTRGS